jgi:hypothetical protein
VSRAVALMRKARIDATTISIVVRKLEEDDSEH